MPPTADLPVLTVRAISAVGVEVPMTYVLGTSRGAHHQGAAAADRPRDRGGRHRPRLPVVAICPRAMPAIASILQEVEERAKGERVAPAELWAQARRALRADRRAGHRPHGDGGLRHRVLGRAGAVAAGVPLARLLGGEPRPIPAYNTCGLGLMAAGRARRRGREAARARLPRREAAARLSDACARTSPRCTPCKQRARRRRRADGRLQPGAQRRRGAGARPRARPARASPGWRSRSATTTTPAPRMLARELTMPVQIGENFSLLAGDADGARRQGLRSGDARPRAHRRRHRLAARGGARRRAQASGCHRISIRRSARICSR